MLSVVSQFVILALFPLVQNRVSDLAQEACDCEQHWNEVKHAGLYEDIPLLFDDVFADVVHQRGTHQENVKQGYYGTLGSQAV